MHSVADWFAYGVWTGDGVLRRALSVDPDRGSRFAWTKLEF
jgi:hypothetical protein